jgi:hypothetical protein
MVTAQRAYPEAMPRPLLPVTEWFDVAPGSTLAGSTLTRRCRECGELVHDMTRHVLEHALRDQGYPRPRQPVEPARMSDSERLKLLRQLDFFARELARRGG